MQTKNVNVAPLNNSSQQQQQQQQQQHTTSQLVEPGRPVALPLPPRTLVQAELEPLPHHQHHHYQLPGEVAGVGVGVPPPYRQPPYHHPSQPPLPLPLHTHSTKFPIEREVILSSSDKNSKIPILNEYRKRGAVAPDAPPVQLAWQDTSDWPSHTAHHTPLQRGMEQTPIQPYSPGPGPVTPASTTHQLYKAQLAAACDTSPLNHSGGGVLPAAHSTPEGEGGGGFPARTYHTIKDIISSRFQRRNDKVEQLSPQSQLRQHGVYLASSPGPSSAEITLRNRQIQQQLIQERTNPTTTQDGANRGTPAPAPMTAPAPHPNQRWRQGQGWTPTDKVRSRSVERLDCDDRTDDDEGGFKLRPMSGGGVGGQSDSGRGSTAYSSGKAKTDTSPEPHLPTPTPTHTPYQGGVDLVECELRHLHMASSTLSESISSVTPPLPPLSPSPPPHRKHKLQPQLGGKPRVWSSGPAKDRSRSRLTSGSFDLELDSMLDEGEREGEGGDNSSDEDESTTVDIRRQLEGLETMYSQVLKLLGVRGRGAGVGVRRQWGGSLSSVPSSVSSRPRQPTHHQQQQRRKQVKDIKGINKRFQRLESHVVTLARSVAHLSSEMRTQHLMIQEMDVIRGELALLRSQTGGSAPHPPHPRLPLQLPSAEQANSRPERVRKLTQFFGDEPPLLRLFLKKLGYEKYAPLFEAERVGLVELPYLTEERLQRLGVPLGPRLRIMQQAQPHPTGGLTLHENTLCIV